MDREKYIQKMLKAPPPAKATRRGLTLYWSKRGGYQGAKQIDLAITKLTKLGFAQGKAHDTSVPDGSFMGGGLTFVNEQGDSVKYNKSYGNTSSDNSYFISVTLAEVKAEKDIVEYVNEGARRDAPPPPPEKDSSGLAYPRGKHIGGGNLRQVMRDKERERRGEEA